MSQYCLAGVDSETVDTLAACKLQRHQHAVEDFTSATELSDEHCDTAGPGSRPRTVGRPLIYRGDVNDPSLTEGERRKLRRRKANRQSARRVRDRRTQMAGSLEAEVTTGSTRDSTGCILPTCMSVLCTRTCLVTNMLGLCDFSECIRYPPLVSAHSNRSNCTAS